MAARNLVIVESPAKARTLSRYLGRNFVVKASVGHVVDLPKSKLGVNVDGDFEPVYEVIHGKGKVLAELKKALVGKEAIYLGPDPDREGEAIAYHVANRIVPKRFKGKVYRVLFNEITKDAVRKAIDNPVEIDIHKFEAQQARRVIDRLVGYQISPLLWDKVRRGLSAGRVQSVAVRLIVERESAIEAFEEVEYWSLKAELSTGDSQAVAFSAQLTEVDGSKIDTKALRAGDKDAFYLRDEAHATEVVEGLPGSGDWEVTAVKKTARQRKPAAPFITSTLQQEASRKHGFQPRRTMSVAQRLYEGADLGEAGTTGLITYMRTDSTRSAPEAIEGARKWVAATYGDDYVPAKVNVYKSKKSAQDAHEAIRPTSLDLPPERVKAFLKADELKLYTLVWNRFVASQMAPARYDQTRVDISAGKCMFRAVGQVQRFDGFLRVYEEGRDAQGPSEDEGSDGALPDLFQGDKLALLGLEPRQHFTQPPPRYTQASLIRELEENGVGRPSTYASIMSTIIGREYVVQDDQKRMRPTQLGVLVTQLLVDAFPDILNVEFTADLENHLDRVEDGSEKWLAVTRRFYDPFKAALERARVSMPDVKGRVEETELPCPDCGKKLVIKWGRNGEFLACPNYPDCKFTSNFTRGDDDSIEIEEPEDTGEACEECGSPMHYKYGRFGKFLGCSGYPECKNVRSLNRPVPTGIACPAVPLGCGEGELVRKVSRRGKVFYSCNRYPKCKFAIWDKPVDSACPECEAPFVVERTTRRAGTVRRCASEGCDYSESVGEAFLEAE
ncbi:MAG: type I DNA topoisomerase [Deltaproteobacteria bacterium]